MKVEVNAVDSYDLESAVINTVKITEDIQSAIDILDNNCRVIPVVDEGNNVILRTDKIYYIESVDKRTYIYTKEGCYEAKYRLYELEELLNNYFLRTSKAMIVNIRKIRTVKAEMNGRLTAELLNGERVIIARSYVKDLKERLGI